MARPSGVPQSPMPKPAGPSIPFYLLPYHEARQHGAKGFDALLWTSREGQRLRFDAIARLCPLAGRRIVDAGCGRADLLGRLLELGIVPAHYTGLEMIPATAQAARRKRYERCRIVRADFVREPERLQVGADVVVFSGSLNTLAPPQFYRTLRAAWEGAGQALAFNFLSSPTWCGEDWLTWHRRDTVLNFCRSLGGEPRFDGSYLEGDCTIAMARSGGPP
jgi:SAM-dependent methyltransferase